MRINFLSRITLVLALSSLAVFAVGHWQQIVAEQKTAAKPGEKSPTVGEYLANVIPAKEIPAFVAKGIGWLVEAQHPDGGWGGGSHAAQQIKDPSLAKSDPATTAFTALALLRTGHTPVSGDYRDCVRKATEFLLKVVEGAPVDGPKITDMTGTQPQAKLGPLVDTSMTAQYFARVLTTLPPNGELTKRVDTALDKCLTKLQKSQQENGSWGNAGGWAPVLQSANACLACELAQAVGKKVDEKVLERARNYQRGNFDAKSGKANAGAAAGVELYAFSGAQRAAAGQARAAADAINKAKSEGKLAPTATVSEENLAKAGVQKEAAKQLAGANAENVAQAARLNDDQLLAGFGNNGGEEFYSFLMTSESLVITGGEPWTKWNSKMHERLTKVQNNDGSWSGHHCITSPVFCTAAVVSCLTTDRDAPLLVKVAQIAGKQAEKMETAKK